MRWTPTFIWLNHRGEEVYRTVGFIPPEEFLALQAFGRAQARILDGDFGAAATFLRDALAVYPTSAFGAQMTYWLGVAEYNVTHDAATLKTVWGELQKKWPQSEWAMRVP